MNTSNDNSRNRKFIFEDGIIKFRRAQSTNINYFKGKTTEKYKSWIKSKYEIERKIRSGVRIWLNGLRSRIMFNSNWLTWISKAGSRVEIKRLFIEARSKRLINRIIKIRFATRMRSSVMNFWMIYLRNKRSKSRFE